MREIYAKHGGGRDCAVDIGLHLQHGFVFSTPEVLAMGRPVTRYGHREHLADPSHVYPKGMQNCWLVWMWIGPAQDVLRYLPYRLRWICWARRGKPLKFYELDKVAQKWQRFAG